MSDIASFVEKLAPQGSLRVEENLGEGFVRLRISEAEARQAKQDIRSVEDAVIELLRNARDAGAQKIFVATTTYDNQRLVVVLDDGKGIPPEMHTKIFEARVTSKLESFHEDFWGVHGRGMALFSIKENAQEASVVASDVGFGSSLKAVFDTNTLPEKRDQSSWPHLTKDEDGITRVGKGPHNIIRTCCEFALEEQDKLNVWLGSPAEIAATIRARVKPKSQDSALIFVDSLEELPLLERPYLCSDATELQKTCSRLGLEMSERTAHRILSDSIKPLRSVLTRLRHHKDEHADEADIMRDARGLKMTQDDLDALSREVEQIFEKYAARYYMSLAQEPTIRVGSSRISIHLDLDKLD